MVVAALGVVLGLLSAVLPASGHSGGSLFVEPPVAKPGDPLLVHGTFLWSDAAVTVDLVAADGSVIPLGPAASDGNGTLEIRLTLPASVRPGTYVVRLTEPAGDTKEVELVVDPGLQLPVVWIVGLLVPAVLGLLAFARLRAGSRAVRDANEGKPADSGISAT